MDLPLAVRLSASFEFGNTNSCLLMIAGKNWFFFNISSKNRFWLRGDGTKVEKGLVVDF